MTPAERVLFTLLVIVVIGVNLAGAKLERRIRTAEASEREAWAEVERLRATMAAHGVDFDLIESNEPAEQ